MNTKTTPLAKAGNVIKSFFGGHSSTMQTINSANYGNIKGGGWLFDSSGLGQDTYFSFGEKDAIIKSYTGCPPVFSIINKQATDIMNGKTFIMQKPEANAKSKSTAKEATNAWSNKMRKLLKKPNSLQNAKQFEAQMIIYTRLFGYCLILPIKPVGYPNEDATELWIIPPFMLNITFKKGKYYNNKGEFIDKIEISFAGETGELNPKEVIFIKDITPGTGFYLPGSPIEPIQQNINNLMGIYESKGTLINYRGALGLLTPELDPNGAIAQTPEEKTDLQNDFLKYGLKSNQWKFIISSAAMKWQQMGIPYKDLMLTEWAVDDTMVVCDTLNYKYKLLSTSTSSSMAGTELKTWKIAQLQDFTIPWSEMIFEQISEAFNAEKYNCEIIKDFSHMPDLQENEMEKAQARKARNEALQIEFYNNLITMNRWLELNDEEPLAETIGNKFYYELVKDGWEFGKSAPSIIQQLDQIK